MPFLATRRRALALIGLAALPVGPALGQGEIASEDPMGAPDDPDKTAFYDVGNWRMVELPNNSSRAFIPSERAAVASWTTDRGGASIGGQAELALEYRILGDDFDGTLTVSASTGQSFPTRVLADGRELASFEATSSDIFDLTEWFGPRLDGLRDLARLTVVMTIEGEEHAVYDVDLAGSDQVLDQMRWVASPYASQESQEEVWDFPDSNNSASSTNPNCFLTTACCDLIGLPDDCFELMALRRFRDDVMMATPQGRADVAHYYTVAPMILARMRRRAGAQGELLRLYRTYILPSAILARLGARNLPWRLYSAMLRRLEQRHGPGMRDV